MQNYFELIVDIGENMLLAGAEVHRVEDSIERMCTAVGFYRTDVFIITSCMFVTVYAKDTNYTQIRRIKTMRTDFERLHRLNDLSREICSRHPTFDEASSRLREIKSVKHIPFWLEALSNILAAGGFTVFFGGGATEALVSALIGFLLCNLVFLLDRVHLNKIFSKALGAFFVTLGAYGAMKVGVVAGMDKIIKIERENKNG